MKTIGQFISKTNNLLGLNLDTLTVTVTVNVTVTVTVTSFGSVSHSAAYQ
jgi:hypothetical protein